MMKKLIFIFFLHYTQITFAQDISDLFYNSNAFLEQFIDPNEGSTAFLTLIIPSGGLSEGFGSAYTSLALDSSYFDFNPAASSLLNFTYGGILHKTWIADSSIESALYTSRIDNLGYGVLGKWFYIPFTQYGDWGSRLSKGYYSEASAVFNISYNFLQGYYFSGVSVGANFKGIYRSMPNYVNNLGEFSNTSGLEQSTFAFACDVGALTRFNLFKFYSSRTRNVSIGFALRNIGLSFLQEPLPSQIALGVSYSPIRPLLFSVDLIQPFVLTNFNIYQSLWFAFGLQATITDYVSIHTGFQFKGANPRFTLGAAMIIEKIELVMNYSIDTTSNIGIPGKISIMVNYNWGDDGRENIKKNAESLYLQGLDEYAKGNSEEAILLWKQSLALDPNFEPARESLKTVEDSVDLQKRIENIQKLD